MDKRLETFLTLCRSLNYRETAKIMNISQPAVTKQIQSLEDELDIQLFRYDHKQLNRSPESYVLEKYALTQQYNYKELLNDLQSSQEKSLSFGVSKTVGEYLILDDLKKYLRSNQRNVKVNIENTQTLLKDLEANVYDFLVIEGNFNKTLYDYRIYSEETFTGICSDQHPFANQTVPIDDLFSQVLIVREEGSGSREIFESQLKAFGSSVHDFEQIISINNIQIIKELVRDQLGISFAYQNIILDNEGLASFRVQEISAPHQIHVVSLKNTKGIKYAEEFFNRSL